MIAEPLPENRRAARQEAAAEADYNSGLRGRARSERPPSGYRTVEGRSRRRFAGAGQ